MGGVGEGGRWEIAVLPLSKSIPPAVKSRLFTGLREAFSLPVTSRRPILPPASARHLERDQYSAEALLSFLTEIELPGVYRLLGVLNGDAYQQGLRFCFGRAVLGGREALVALDHLWTAQYFEGLPVKVDVFAERTLKASVHELGHTFGLTHCRSACVMQFSLSRLELDAKPLTFCKRCHAALDAALSRG